jgi:hypothetical protein
MLSVVVNGVFHDLSVDQGDFGVLCCADMVLCG